MFPSVAVLFFKVVRTVGHGHHHRESDGEREDQEQRIDDVADGHCEGGRTCRRVDGAGVHHHQDGTRYAESADDPFQIIEESGGIEDPNDDKRDRSGEQMAE